MFVILVVKHRRHLTYAEDTKRKSLVRFKQLDLGSCVVVFAD